MHMGMVVELLSPCVQDGDEADPGAEMLRIAGHRGKRTGGSPEEGIVCLLYTSRCV